MACQLRCGERAARSSHLHRIITHRQVIYWMYFLYLTNLAMG